MSDNTSMDNLTCEQFYKVYIARLSSPDWSFDFPEFVNFTITDDVIGWISRNINRFDSTEFLNKFMVAVMRGDRYAYDVKDEIEEVISIMLNNGAVPNIDLLIQRTYQEIRNVSFEDEVYDYHARAMLIDILSKKGFDFSKCADWKNIRAVYWEYVDEYRHNLLYSEGSTQEEKTKFELNRLGNIKILSEHLRTTFPNQNDDSKL